MRHAGDDAGGDGADADYPAGHAAAAEGPSRNCHCFSAATRSNPRTEAAGKGACKIAGQSFCRRLPHRRRSLLPAPAEEQKPPETEVNKGSATGLPLPRFAALRSDEVNLRAGPGTGYPIDWVYKRRDSGGDLA